MLQNALSANSMDNFPLVFVHDFVTEKWQAVVLVILVQLALDVVWCISLAVLVGVVVVVVYEIKHFEKVGVRLFILN